MAIREIGSTAWAPQVLENAVLVLLKQHPSHGYALLDPVQRLGVEVADVSRLYRVLRKLESEGIVASCWDTSAGGRGPARKIFSLTRAGQRDLPQRMKTLRGNCEVMQRIERRYLELTREGA